MNASAAGMNPQPLEKKPAWSDLLAQSYRLDGERFWTLFRIALLPAALACFWPYVQRIGVRQLWGMGWIGFGSPGKFAVLVASGWVDGAFYWTLSGFFFAAVASNILADPDKPMPPFSDAYTQARNRIGLVMVVAMICWTLFWIGRAAGIFALFGLLDRLRVRPGFYGTMLLVSVPLLLLAGLLSRLGLTIPVLMHEPDTGLGRAVRISLRDTENWEPFFMMFLVKSALLAFGMYWLSGLGLGWLWRHGVLNNTTYPWVSQAFRIAIAAALESPLFIAFSVLYRDTCVTREDALPAAVG